MRSFLGFLIFTTSLVAIIAVVVVPLVVRPLVADAVRAQSPFGDDLLDVGDEVDALGLIGGRIGTIHITGANLEAGQALVGSLEVSAGRVSLDRSFETIRGALLAVRVPHPDGSVVPLERIDLSGSSDAVQASAVVTRDTALAILSRALADAGLAADGLELIEGGAAVEVLGQRAEMAIGVVDGALVVPSPFGQGDVVLYGPELDDAWRLTGASVTPTGMVVMAEVDATRVLTGS